MTSAPEFPLEMKALIQDSILAVIWPKRKIIEFLQVSGATETDLAIVKSPDWEHLRRPEVIEAAFFRLSGRSDRGFMVFQNMLSRLNDWTYYDPYYFDKLGKLDRTAANEQLGRLRERLKQRNDATVAAKRAASAMAEASTRLDELSAISRSFQELSVGRIKPQQRGREFEQFLVRLFNHQGVTMSEGFRLVGEQIDGAFKFEGENYITEAKWQDASVSTEALYKFAMKTDGKMYGRGVFISVNAYSSEGIPAIVRGKHIKTILIDGFDLFHVMEGRTALAALLDVKIRAAQTRGDVYVDGVSGISKV